MKLTHASVFSGIGGPEVAATMLGWDNLFHCEINPFGRAVLDYWYPNAKSYEDITTTDFSEWRGRVTVLTGGFPCQPFSYAGQRRGAQDDRYLWPYMFRCIDQVQPDWVVAENVAGITTMVEQGKVSPMAHQASLFDEDNGVQRYRLRETFTLERICRDLEGHGYEVQPVLIPACAVEAPHRRDRVFIVARRVASHTPCRGEGTPGQGCGSESHGSGPYQQPSQWGAASEWSDRFYAILRHVANAANDRLQHGAESRGEGCETGAIQGQRNRAKLHISTKADGCGRNDADTDNERQPGRCSEDRGEWSDIAKVIRREFLGIAEGHHDYEVGERWRNFPTVSPVHRGNDGIPFRMDGASLSFGKWRTEALKAYENAIVPQVMYEIFRAIEMTYQ